MNTLQPMHALYDHDCRGVTIIERYRDGSYVRGWLSCVQAEPDGVSMDWDTDGGEFRSTCFRPGTWSAAGDSGRIELTRLGSDQNALNIPPYDVVSYIIESTALPFPTLPGAS